jgi:L-gulonate 3-dehydrogenase
VVSEFKVAGTGHAVGIVGAGSIGVSFALVFARAGWQVHMQDPDAARRAAVPDEITARADALRTFDLVSEATDTLLARVNISERLEDAVNAVELVIECAPERIDVKRELFAKLDVLAPREAILVSASSAIPVSSYASELEGRARCLVAHPGNPPYLIPVIELVPAAFTTQHAVQRAKEVFASAHMQPVTVQKEIEGFIFNRLQGAVLREAYCLVRDGVASVEDIDLVMREGVGLRWSVIGPFETVDLNTRGGIASHAEKMGPAYARMGAARGQYDPWTPDLVEKVDSARRELLPLEQWDSRVNWRDQQLMRILRDRNKANSTSQN